MDEELLLLLPLLLPLLPLEAGAVAMAAAASVVDMEVCSVVLLIGVHAPPHDIRDRITKQHARGEGATRPAHNPNQAREEGSLQERAPSLAVDAEEEVAMARR